MLPLRWHPAGWLGAGMRSIARPGINVSGVSPNRNCAAAAFLRH